VCVYIYKWEMSLDEVDMRETCHVMRSGDHNNLVVYLIRENMEYSVAFVSFLIVSRDNGMRWKLGMCHLSPVSVTRGTRGYVVTR